MNMLTITMMITRMKNIACSWIRTRVLQMMKEMRGKGVMAMVMGIHGKATGVFASTLERRRFRGGQSVAAEAGTAAVVTDMEMDSEVVEWMPSMGHNTRWRTKRMTRTTTISPMVITSSPPLSRFDSLPLMDKSELNFFP
jgi:hypothetical protein